jgi:hypothetical protein
VSNRMSKLCSFAFAVLTALGIRLWRKAPPISSVEDAGRHSLVGEGGGGQPPSQAEH